MSSDGDGKVDGDLENFPQANVLKFKAREGVDPVGSCGGEGKRVGVGHQVAGLEYVVYIYLAGYLGWAAKGVGLVGNDGRSSPREPEDIVALVQVVGSSVA